MLLESELCKLLQVIRVFGKELSRSTSPVSMSTLAVMGSAFLLFIVSDGDYWSQVILNSSLNLLIGSIKDTDEIHFFETSSI